MEFCAICTASALATWNRVEDAALTLALTLTLITRTTYPNRVLDFVSPDWFLVFWKALGAPLLSSSLTTPARDGRLAYRVL